MRILRLLFCAVPLSTFACRAEGTEREPPDSRSASSSSLVLYPGAPTAPWGEPEFFDPESSRPKTRLEYGPIEREGALSESEVLRAVKHRDNTLRYCYWHALADHPGLHGKVVVEFVVDTEGKASREKKQHSDLRDESVADCVLKKLDALHFPKRDRETAIVLSLIFKPG